MAVEYGIAVVLSLWNLLTEAAIRRRSVRLVQTHNHKIYNWKLAINFLAIGVVDPDTS